MTKYLRARAEGKSPPDSVMPTFRLVGRPLLTTTLILALGFLGLVFSGSVANQTPGLLVALTVVIALLADFLPFPPLLFALDRNRPHAGARSRVLPPDNPPIAARPYRVTRSGYGKRKLRTGAVRIHGSCRAAPLEDVCAPAVHRAAE